MLNTPDFVTPIVTVPPGTHPQGFCKYKVISLFHKEPSFKRFQTLWQMYMWNNAGRMFSIFILRDFVVLQIFFLRQTLKDLLNIQVRGLLLHSAMSRGSNFTFTSTKNTSDRIIAEVSKPCNVIFLIGRWESKSQSLHFVSQMEAEHGPFIKIVAEFFHRLLYNPILFTLLQG